MRSARLLDKRMKSPIQEILVDAALPQIGDLLDARRMYDLFARELGVGNHRADCQIASAKLRPGRNCLVCYRLRLTEPETGAIWEQLLSLLAFRKGESAERFATAQTQAIAPSTIGKGLFYLPELEAVVWVFPNDRKLTSLPAVTDAERLKLEILPEVVETAWGVRWAIRAVTSEVAQYAPERSCTLRATLALTDSKTGETTTQVIFGKTYCVGEGETAWRKMQGLWQSEVRKQGRLLIPQPLVYQPEINTVWQQGLAGTSLDECIVGVDRSPALLEKAGAAVAALHRTRLPDLPNQSDDVFSKLKMAENTLARAVPSCGQTLHSLVGRLRASFNLIGQRPLATLHGDLHLKNFFVAGGKIALIDLDNLYPGDPLRDVGSFLASFMYRGVLEGVPAALTERLASRFVDAYRANVEWPVSANALNWHTAAALVYERAYRHVLRLKEDPAAVNNRLLDVALRLSQDLET